MLSKLIAIRPINPRFAEITADKYTELVLSTDTDTKEFVKLLWDGLDSGRDDIIAIVRGFYVLIEDEKEKSKIEEALNNLPE